MKFFKTFFTLSAFFTIILNATTIKDIKFDGLIHISNQIAKEMLGFGIGDSVNIDKIDKSISRFFEQNYFKDIWVSEDNGILTYHFVEKPVIAQVEIVGYDDKKDDIKTMLDIKKGDIYDQESINNAKNQILNYLEQK